MTKRQERTKGTKGKLRDAFWELYTTKGIEQISVKEITDLAGYNRGTFYLYYRDVRDVLEQIEASLMEKITGLICSYPDSPQRKITCRDISDFFSSIIALYEEEKKYITVLFSNHGDPGFIASFKKSICDFCRDRFPGEETLPAPYREYCLEYCISGLLSMVAKWIENDRDLSVEELLILLMDLSVRSGLLPLSSFDLPKELSDGLPEGLR